MAFLTLNQEIGTGQILGHRYFGGQAATKPEKPKVASTRSIAAGNGDLTYGPRSMVHSTYSGFGSGF